MIALSSNREWSIEDKCWRLGHSQTSVATSAVVVNNPLALRIHSNLPLVPTLD